MVDVTAPVDSPLPFFDVSKTIPAETVEETLLPSTPADALASQLESDPPPSPPPGGSCAGRALGAKHKQVVAAATVTTASRSALITAGSPRRREST